MGAKNKHTLDKTIHLKLYIKYMVSIRCKMVVKSELNKLGLQYSAVDLGEVDLPNVITDDQFLLLKNALLEFGLELMDDKKAMLIEKIKNVVIEMVHYSDELPQAKNSDYISDKLQQDYTYLSSLFSETMGITLEHYIIKHKIERVKELIIYNELNLTEIAWKMHYSSVAHLSHQFKKITGLTPSFFKSLKHKRRSPIENL